MIRRPPRATPTAPLFPYPALFRAPRGDEGIEVRDVVCDPAAELGVGRPHALDSPVLQGARRHGPQVGSSLALAKPARLDLYDVALGNHAAPQRNPDTIWVR